jgi:hypothetical protein
MLSKGHSVLFGNPGAGACVVVRKDFTLGQVIGHPDELAVLEASLSLTEDAHLLCLSESEDYLKHIDDIKGMEEAYAALRKELIAGAEYSPVAAAFAGSLIHFPTTTTEGMRAGVRRS